MAGDPIEQIMSALVSARSVNPQDGAARKARLKDERRSVGASPGVPHNRTPQSRWADSREAGSTGKIGISDRDMTPVIIDQLNEVIVSLKVQIHREQDPTKRKALEQRAAAIRQQVLALGGEPVWADETIEQGLRKLQGFGRVGAPALEEEVARLRQATGFHEHNVRKMIEDSLADPNKQISVGGIIVRGGRVFTQDEYRQFRQEQNTAAARVLEQSGLDSESAQQFASVFRSEIAKGRNPKDVIDSIRTTVGGRRLQREVEAGAARGETAEQVVDRFRAAGKAAHMALAPQVQTDRLDELLSSAGLIPDPPVRDEMDQKLHQIGQQNAGKPQGQAPGPRVASIGSDVSALTPVDQVMGVVTGRTLADTAPPGVRGVTPSDQEILSMSEADQMEVLFPGATIDRSKFTGGTTAPTGAETDADLVPDVAGPPAPEGVDLGDFTLPAAPNLSLTVGSVKELASELGISIPSDEELYEQARQMVARQALSRRQIVERELARFEREFPNEFEKAKQRIMESAAELSAARQEEMAARGMFYSSIMAGALKEIDEKTMEMISDISIRAANRVEELRDEIRDIAEWEVLEQEVVFQQLQEKNQDRLLKLQEMQFEIAARADQLAIAKWQAEVQKALSEREQRLTEMQMEMDQARQVAGDQAIGLLLNNPTLQQFMKEMHIDSKMLEGMDMMAKTALVQGIMTWAQFDLNKKQTEAYTAGLLANTSIAKAKEEREKARFEAVEEPTFGEEAAARKAEFEIITTQADLLKDQANVAKAANKLQLTRTALTQQLLGGEIGIGDLSDAQMQLLGLKKPDPNVQKRIESEAAQLDLMADLLTGKKNLTDLTPAQQQLLGFAPDDLEADTKKRMIADILSGKIDPTQLSEGQRQLLGISLPTEADIAVREQQQRIASLWNAVLSGKRQVSTLDDAERLVLGLEKPQPVVDPQAAISHFIDVAVPQINSLLQEAGQPGFLGQLKKSPEIGQMWLARTQNVIDASKQVLPFVPEDVRPAYSQLLNDLHAAAQKVIKPISEGKDPAPEQEKKWTQRVKDFYNWHLALFDTTKRLLANFLVGDIHQLLQGKE